MTDDLRALLAAIVADPADDTARLVYADCLEERGHLPRARFIRLQIEAERLHPDSNARARLEDQAQAILVDHWIDWWGEVCAAVGFAVPMPVPRGTIGRLMRRFRNPPGHPYMLSRFGVVQRSSLMLPRDVRLSGLDRTLTLFRRGFPESLHASIVERNPGLGFLQHWTMASPLQELHLTAPYSELWIDDSHLANLRSLTLQGFDPSVLGAVLGSPHLGQLDALHFDVWRVDPDYDQRFADELAPALTLTGTRQLKRLRIPLWTDRAAGVLANANNLAGIESLEIAVLPPYDGDEWLANPDFDGQAQRLAMLARSPHLAACANSGSRDTWTRPALKLWSAIRPGRDCGSSMFVSSFGPTRSVRRSRRMTCGNWRS